MGQGENRQHFLKVPARDMKKIHSEGLCQKLLSWMLMGSGPAWGAQSQEDFWAEKTEIPKGPERKCLFEETKLTKRRRTLASGGVGVQLLVVSGKRESCQWVLLPNKEESHKALTF